MANSAPSCSSSIIPSSSSSSIAISSNSTTTTTATALISTTNNNNHNHNYLNHQLDELGKSTESNLNQRSSVLISNSSSSNSSSLVESSTSASSSSSNLNVTMNGKSYTKNCSSASASSLSCNSSADSSGLAKPKPNLIVACSSSSSSSSSSTSVDCGATNPPIPSTTTATTVTETTSNTGGLLLAPVVDIKTEPESPPPNSQRANSGSSTSSSAVIHFNSCNSSLASSNGTNCLASSSSSGHQGQPVTATAAATSITCSSPSSSTSAGHIASTTNSSATSTPNNPSHNQASQNIMDFHQVSVSTIPSHHNSHPGGPTGTTHHHSSHVATVVGQTTITPVHPHQQQHQIHSHHSHPQHQQHAHHQQQPHPHSHSGTLHPSSNPHSNGGSHQSSTTILTIPQSHPHSQNHIASSGGGGGPVVTDATSTPSNSDTSTNPKESIDEQCPVCGDRVSGYHYGLLTCESCKGFFKRTVQNKKVYTCVADRTCHIDKSQRKRCPYCRFQKCLDVGMKLEAVRADRMRGGRNKFGPMYKRDRARRLQLMRQKQFTKIPHSLHHGGHGSHGHHNSSAGMLGPPGATLLPTEALNFLCVGGAGSGTSQLFDGVKQELIQIPQLSSSTSSPDSSPSPGNGAINQAVAAAAAAAAAQLAASGGSSGGQGNGHHFVQPSVSLQASNNLQQQQSGPNGGSGSGSSIPSMINPASGDHLLKWSNGGAGTSSKSSSSNSSTNSAMHNSNNYNDNNNNNNNNSHHHSNGNSKLIIPQLIRELQISMPDDKEWQAQLFGLLQNQTYNQCEVDLFELMCKVIDQSLFAQVDWARNSIFFKDLKVDDQMKLLQHAWSDMLVLDHIHQRLHVCLPDETTLPNGQKFDLLSLALLGVPQVADQLHRVSARLQELKLDSNDYICLKFLLLLNPEVRGLTNYKLVQEAHDQTKQALHEYTVNFYSQISDKFNHLLSLVPEIRALTMRGEDFLYYKHVNGMAPTQTLLMEMLHAKKK